MKKYIFIKADTNDADYVYRKTEVTDQQIEFVIPLINAIKNNKGSYNFLHGEFVREDEKEVEEMYVASGLCSQEVLDFFLDNFCPYGEHGIHTIESIEILNVESEQKLL